MYESQSNMNSINSKHCFRCHSVRSNNIFPWPSLQPSSLSFDGSGECCSITNAKNRQNADIKYNNTNRINQSCSSNIKKTYCNQCQMYGFNHYSSSNSSDCNCVKLLHFNCTENNEVFKTSALNFSNIDANNTLLCTMESKITETVSASVSREPSTCMHRSSNNKCITTMSFNYCNNNSIRKQQINECKCLNMENYNINEANICNTEKSVHESLNMVNFYNENEAKYYRNNNKTTSSVNGEKSIRRIVKRSSHALSSTLFYSPILVMCIIFLVFSLRCTTVAADVTPEKDYYNTTEEGSKCYI